MARTTIRWGAIAATTMMVAVALAAATPASPAGAAAPGDGTGAIGGTLRESPGFWSISLRLQGSFALSGRTYGFFGQLDANSCCSPMGSSGGGTWHFGGWLLSADSVLSGTVGVAVASSATMNYARSELTPGAPYWLDMQLSGPATADLPDGRSVNFHVEFSVQGKLSYNSPLSGSCYYVACSYDGTYNEVASPSGPTGSESGFALGLHVSGTLPTFPCGDTCRTTFSGVMTPSGVATLAGVPDPSSAESYAATFLITTASAAGWADYVEPGTPLCPAKGSAAGHVEVNAAALGVVTHSAAPHVIGQVDGIYLSASFTYDRIGSAAVIVAKGWVRVYYHSLDTGASHYFDQAVFGAGAGVFSVDPVQAATACLNPGQVAVAYDVAAEVSFETHKLGQL